ncbi:hypothetical protein BJP36_43210 [Moorena producens JHB]|uniref:Uncharacterized protein n=1 Tax=Moorena producens (strain JHB) TaxID=1454205 RepID=A0A9Q9UVT5_MOOP1|nr:hypothetical protein [Moorena producens]WAN69171.1 hypothetical protein BJP36_43210 [Moorena producens JHB]
MRYTNFFPVPSSPPGRGRGWFPDPLFPAPCYLKPIILYLTELKTAGMTNDIQLIT